MDPEFVQLERVTGSKDLQKLYNQVVPDKSSKEAKCLASSLHFLSAQFELISAKNTGLRASLLGKKKHKTKGQVLSTLANSSGSLTMSPATIQSALGLLAQKDQEREEVLARKASSKAARQAAKVNKLALQAAAAERRGVKKRGGRRRRKRRPKSWLNRREREQKPSLLHHPQRREISYLNQYQTGPPRSRQLDN
jgi:hypothetical protein